MVGVCVLPVAVSAAKVFFATGATAVAAVTTVVDAVATVFIV